MIDRFGGFLSSYEPFDTNEVFFHRFWCFDDFWDADVLNSSLSLLPHSFGQTILFFDALWSCMVVVMIVTFEGVCDDFLNVDRPRCDQERIC